MLNREDSKVQILHIQKLLMSQGKDKKSGKKALAALSLKPVVEELLKLNDIETWLVTQRVRFMNKPMTKRILDMQSSRDALKADKKKSLTRLRRLLRDPKFEENQSILDIDLSPYLEPVMNFIPVIDLVAAASCYGAAWKDGKAVSDRISK